MKFQTQNFENPNALKYRHVHCGHNSIPLSALFGRLGDKESPKIVPHSDLAKMPEAISQEPLISRVRLRQNWLPGTRESYSKIAPNKKKCGGVKLAKT